MHAIKCILKKCPITGAEKMIFLRKIVIFHTKYPQNFSRLAPLGAIILSTPPPVTGNPEYPPLNNLPQQQMLSSCNGCIFML